MYLVGQPHPNRETARRLLERLVAESQVLVTSAEVFQEILHRYLAIRRPDAIGPAFDALHGVVDQIFGIDIEVVERARQLSAESTELSARDVLHAAVMEREGVTRILSFDRKFDRYSALTRIWD